MVRSSILTMTDEESAPSEDAVDRASATTEHVAALYERTAEVLERSAAGSGRDAVNETIAIFSDRLRGPLAGSSRRWSCSSIASTAP